MKNYISNIAYKKILILLFLLVFAFCFAMFQGGFVSWFIFFAATPFLIYSIALCFVPIVIKNVKRKIKPEMIVRGGKVQVKVSFENHTPFPLLFMTVREKLNTDGLNIYMEGLTNNLFLVGTKRHLEWTYEMRNVPRGEFVFEGLEVVVTDFFGWTRRVIDVPKHDVMIVFPKVTDIAFQNINMQYDQGNTSVSRSLVKDQSIATGVRKYEEGDRFSWIHWKSFAKSGELRTKEFEDIQAQNIVLYLDRGYQHNFESVVDLTASLLKVAVKQKAEISFFTTGSERKYFPLVRTESQLNRVMQYLAVTQMEEYTSLLETAISAEQQLVNRATALIVTSRLNENLENLLMSGSKIARAIICIVVVDEENFRKLDVQKKNVGKNKLVYVTESMFAETLHEVGRR